jgi:hypothetical protein
MLIEAKESDQVPHGSWSRWLKTNFELSQPTAVRCMRLARMAEADPTIINVDQSRSYAKSIGQKPARSAWKPVFTAADRVDVTRLADERQKQADEIKLQTGRTRQSQMFRRRNN